MIRRTRTDANGTHTGRKRFVTEDRAQTVQDFAVGIGIFLLAVAFVFSFVPTIITPFADGGSTQTAQADRIAATIVENASASTNGSNELDWDEFTSTYDGDSEELSAALGLRKADGNAIDNVNITVINVTELSSDDPTYEFQSGDNYDGQAGASAARIVTDDKGKCDPACRLIVRVW